MSHRAPNLENLPFRRAKRAVQYTPAGHLIGTQILTEQASDNPI